MTREEEIHIAEQIKDYLCEGNPIWDVDMISEVMDVAIEALKFRGAYEIAVKAANKAFEDRKTQWVEWIPCSDEKLPQEYENVLVTDENGKVLMAYYIQDMSEAMSIDWYDVNGWLIKPTAWMALPHPFFDPTPQQEGEINE